MKLLLIKILFIQSLILAQSQDPFEINQYMLAENYEQSGNLQKALEIIENLFQKNPDNPNYFNKLYNLYINTKKYETAIRFLELRIKSYPEDPSLYGMLGAVYYLMGDIKNAKFYWDSPIKKNPSNPFLYRIITNYAIEKRAFEIAIDYLETAKKISNDPTIFAIDLGELYLITMQYEKAIKEYCELLLRNITMQTFVDNKIFSYANKPDFLDIASEIVKGYENKGTVFKYLLAKLYSEKREFNKAFDLYKKIEKEQPTSNQQLLNFANFLINENEFEIAKEVFEYTYNNSDNQAIKSSAKLGLAKTLEAILWRDFNNQNDIWKNYFNPKYSSELQTNKTIAAFQDVINLFKHSDVAIESMYSIGRINFYISNNLKTAEEYFLEIVNNYPTSRFAGKSYLELGLIAINKNDFNQAKEYFQKVESSLSINDEEKLSANFYLSKLFALDGNFLVASEKLKKITINVKNDYTNDALEFSLLLNISKNDSINLIKFTKAEMLLIQRKYNEAQSLFDEISQIQQSLIFQPFCSIKSAAIDIALNNYDKAIEKLDKIYEAKEKNIFSDKALYLKARIFQYALKDDQKAIENYQKILIEFPKSIYLDESRDCIIRLKEVKKSREKDA